jgi:hypothetical protein
VPGLCNDCKLTSIHQAVSKASIDRDYEEEIAALGLPALKGDTDLQRRHAESLRHRFFENEGNLRLARLLRSAPRIYGAVSKEQQTAMMDATRKSGWNNDFPGAFAYANAKLPKSHYEEVLGERFSDKPQEYIDILRVMLSETDAKTIIVTLLR